MVSRGEITGNNVEMTTKSDLEGDQAVVAEEVVVVEVAVEVVEEAAVGVMVEAEAEVVVEAEAEVVVEEVVEEAEEEAAVGVSEAEIRDADNQTN